MTSTLQEYHLMMSQMQEQQPMTSSLKGQHVLTTLQLVQTEPTVLATISDGFNEMVESSPN